MNILHYASHSSELADRILGQFEVLFHDILPGKDVIRGTHRTFETDTVTIYCLYPTYYTVRVENHIFRAIIQDIPLIYQKKHT